MQRIIRDDCKQLYDNKMDSLEKFLGTVFQDWTKNK